MVARHVPITSTPTLAEAISVLFARPKRPYIGELRINGYADLQPDAAAFLKPR